jgi:hypothetical protein
VLFIFDIHYGNLYLSNLRSKKLFKPSAIIIGCIAAAAISGTDLNRYKNPAYRPEPS